MVQNQEPTAEISETLVPLEPEDVLADSISRGFEVGMIIGAAVTNFALDTLKMVNDSFWATIGRLGLK